jgi:hypothetical protein
MQTQTVLQGSFFLPSFAACESGFDKMGKEEWQTMIDYWISYA